MKKSLFTLTCIVQGFLAISQPLGSYEFAGSGTCPNQSPNVTTQPVNSEFEPFSMQNVYCVSTGNVFNTKSWNTSAVLNESEFIQFGAHTISCYRMNLDSIIFEFRNTAAGNTPTWHLRSSVDNYSSDISTGVSATSTSMLRDTIVLNQSDFSLLAEVKFRIYLTEMGSVGAAFRIDNVQIFGSETLVGTVDYYVDSDGDGFGTGIATPACTNPGGYSLNNLDCDDNNAAINPNTFWYNDADSDGYGSDLAFEIGCTSTFLNPVTTGDDCDDNDVVINPATVWYQDNDSDGFGDDLITETGCSSTLTNPVLVGGDCSDIASDLNPNTVWYEDLDGDGFGDNNTTEVGCSSTLTNPILVGGDCNDGDVYVNPSSSDDDTDVFGDGIDNDCDGDTDEGIDMSQWPHSYYYADRDGDFYVDYSDEQYTPGIPGWPYIHEFDALGDDCNDTIETIHPNAIEIPNDGIDQNCDGVDGYLTISEISKSILKIFPNPGTSSLFVSTSNFEKGIFTIQIIDNQGKIILKDELDLNHLGIMEINTSEFAKGAYQIVIQNDKQIYRNSWVKI